jgi:hypothetical protein
MENHRLQITTSDCTLEFSKQFAKDIFLVLELDAIRRNCEALQFPLAQLRVSKGNSINIVIERSELAVNIIVEEHAYYQVIMMRNLSECALNLLLMEPIENYAVYVSGSRELPD